MKLFKTLLLAALTAGAAMAQADEASIRKNLAERIPQLKQIDEVNKTAVPGLFEIRVNGTEIFYVDADANHLIQGVPETTLPFPEIANANKFKAATASGSKT